MGMTPTKGGTDKWFLTLLFWTKVLSALAVCALCLWIGLGNGTETILAWQYSSKPWWDSRNEPVIGDALGVQKLELRVPKTTQGFPTRIAVMGTTDRIPNTSDMAMRFRRDPIWSSNRNRDN